MSRLTIRRKGLIRAAAISAAGLAGAIVPMSAFGQSLTINLQLTPGLAGSTGAHTDFLTPVNNNTPIPVYVYATVTGVNAPSGTDFDGLQYAYYNIANSGPSNGTLSAGGVTSAAVTGTTSTIADDNFNGGVETGTGETSEVGNGVQPGALTNAGGISIGSTAAATSIAKPRSANIVWSNVTDAGTNIYTSGDSTSFLVETLMYTPTAFSPSLSGSAAKNQTNLSVSIPTAALAAADLVGANFWADSTSTSAPTGFNNGTYTAGTGVTFTDTLVGDANADGKVDSGDLLKVLQNFGSSSQSWALGNFIPDPTVDSGDLLKVLQNFGGTLSSGPLVADADFLADPTAMALAQSYGLDIVASPAVPEPMSLSMLGLVGAAALTRRRRRS